MFNKRELFGKNIRKYRKLQNISQEELAFRSNLHRTYISDIERGQRNVSLDNIDKLAKALNIKITKLLE
ncbi:transcriptional regulator [Candidatus Gottesmanbacteria bacterium RIFCSPHIGHO2_01_FULL_39_10]|uniref:Transcriptional regulator n=1 Tax=Candidatus Gottesmanbacteria bacterium RIFCSPHIGHO2_01_FULL_39_10 TaxID=1798375 RepID=A0A1F5ZLH0_9BACT|nr:MAG: transcriptional regulator [Candidatus Gottesmanbacteria bacterium RIFCSPHIGHO2_01_FULL_39_10]